MTNEKTTKETPKTAADPAAMHNPFAAFDPMAVWTQTQANFQKMFSEAYTRGQSWADEYAAIESQMFQRANQAIDTWAQLCHDTLAYSAQLSAQARKLGFEAARKAGIGA